VSIRSQPRGAGVAARRGEAVVIYALGRAWSSFVSSVCISSSDAWGDFSPVIARSTYLVNRVASWFDSGGAGIGAVSGCLSRVS
jgi:hypothetical protein